MRVRSKVVGTAERPRFNVFRSLRHIYVQVIDDNAGHTVASASSIDKDIRDQIEGMEKSEAARVVGRVAAERALASGVKQVVFDRGGYQYHGRVKAVAEAAREAGLDF
jgi:large subunit ribosomal protein L18